MSIDSEQPQAPVSERFPAGVAYIDGRFCPIAEARIPVRTHVCPAPARPGPLGV
jgi:hypothetical protein